MDATERNHQFDAPTSCEFRRELALDEVMQVESSTRYLEFGIGDNRVWLFFFRSLFSVLRLVTAVNVLSAIFGAPREHKIGARNSEEESTAYSPAASRPA